MIGVDPFRWTPHSLEKRVQEVHQGGKDPSAAPVGVSPPVGGACPVRPRARVVVSGVVDKGLYFVTRIKWGARYKVTGRRKVLKNKGLTSDHTIEWTTDKARRACAVPLGRALRLPSAGVHPVQTPSSLHAARDTATAQEQSVRTTRDSALDTR